MKLSRILLYAFLMTLVSDTLTSCRDELCYNHYPSLDVNLVWEQEWERNYGMDLQSEWDASHYGFEYASLRPTHPEWVNFVRFSADGSRHETYMQHDKENIIIDTGEGQSLLLYNGDTEYIVLEDMASVANARATSTARARSSISYVMAQHPGLSTTNPPDVIYSAYVDEVPYVESHTVRPMTIKMQPLVFTYVIRYEFEHGKEHIKLARGALGGMAESVFLRDSRTSDQATIILFDCATTDYGCEAHVRSFGIPGFPDDYFGRGDERAASRPYTLNLEVLLTNGKVVEFNFDVADQIARQPKGGVIVVDGLRIEDEQNEPQESTGGFDVDLSGWNNVDIDLPI
ncbi:MAG: DUF5119 domain-containing protein [Muribaculaceae bacterium]|nr:DUF5119 domain-containing protein [Muribaculaceae bacterium]